MNGDRQGQACVMGIVITQQREIAARRKAFASWSRKHTVTVANQR